MDRTSVSSRSISASSDSDYSESGFEAEPLLPSQFFEGRKKSEALDPEKRLMLAVLTDAVRCYQVGFHAQKTSRIRAFREAEEWLFSAKGYGPFSCENVCYALDITPDYLRKMLRKWRVRRLDGARITIVRRSAG
ncbi:MAG: hypothetical protein JO212_19050, partial [Acetobacteraceae bacterium]|nr:hypothetical protein [Acetobacteraceae bacterium]